jgi:hypothetical protein
MFLLFFSGIDLRQAAAALRLSGEVDWWNLRLRSALTRCLRSFRTAFESGLLSISVSGSQLHATRLDDLGAMVAHGAPQPSMAGKQTCAAASHTQKLNPSLLRSGSGSCSAVSVPSNLVAEFEKNQLNGSHIYDLTHVSVHAVCSCLVESGARALVSHACFSQNYSVRRPVSVMPELQQNFTAVLYSSARAAFSKGWNIRRCSVRRMLPLFGPALCALSHPAMQFGSLCTLSASRS